MGFSIGSAPNTAVMRGVCGCKWEEPELFFMEEGSAQKYLCHGGSGFGTRATQNRALPNQPNLNDNQLEPCPTAGNGWVLVKFF